MAGAQGGEEEPRGSVLLPHTVTAVAPALLCGNGPAPGGLVPAAAGRVSRGDCVLTVFCSRFQARLWRKFRLVRTSCISFARLFWCLGRLRALSAWVKVAVEPG